MNAVIVHGMPPRHMYLDPTTSSPSNDPWLPWIQKQLLIRGIDAQAPEMPTPYEPEYAAWRRRFEREDLHADTIVIGSSGGAGFLVRWLSSNPSVHLRKVILVAPWLDPALRAAAPGVRYRAFHYGHFSHWDMPSPEFRELLDEIVDEGA